MKTACALVGMRLRGLPGIVRDVRSELWEATDARLGAGLVDSLFVARELEGIHRPFSRSLGLKLRGVRRARHEPA